MDKFLFNPSHFKS